MTVTNRWTLVAISLLAVELAQAGASAPGAGKEWLNDVLVIVSPGPDAMGGRVPGGWHGQDGARIEVTQEAAFSGDSSLQVQLGRKTGGCSRILTMPPGDSPIVFSCRVFVPPGQDLVEMPAVHIWRGHGVVLAQAEPAKQTDTWVESVLDLERPKGQLFYFGVLASAKDDQQPFYYVDAFVLKEKGSEHNLLEPTNADFEDDAGDKRDRLIADFRPDLLNVWQASDLNKDGLFHRHGVRVASWGKVEYDACIDWDKRLEEFKEVASTRDLEGKIVSRPTHPPFTCPMCHHSPVWHEYQKAGLTRIVGENDALGQDNIVRATFRSGLDSCFCEHCQRDFRQHLRRRFTQQQLPRLLPGPVGEFSIAEHIRRIRPDHPHFALLEDPVAREFVRSQYLHEKRFLSDIAGSIREEATAQGRVVPFFGNQGSPWGGNRMTPYSVVVSDLVDAQCLECNLLVPYHKPHRHAWGALQYKLMRATSRDRKPVWPLVDTSKFQKFPTGAQLYAAEALMNGAVPMLIWAPMGFPDRSVYDNHAVFARFLSENRSLFLRRSPVAKVALVYSLPTCFWRHFATYWQYWRIGSNHGKWIGGVSRVLQDAHIPHEVVIFGHPDLFDEAEQLAALADYEVLVLTEVDCLADRQAEAVSSFAEGGGRVVVLGELGSRTEEYLSRKEPVLRQLAAAVATRGRVTVLPASHASDFMDMRSEPAQVDYAYATLRDALRPSQPLIRTDAPKTLAMSLWQDEDSRRLALHMVNYDVDLDRHAFVAAEGVTVTLRTPVNFAFNRIRLLAPGKAEVVVPFQRSDDAVSFRIPSVEHYALAVLTTDDELAAANLIAETLRAIDRADVAARGPQPGVESARTQLAEAESLYGGGDYAQAAKQARGALEAIPALPR